MRHTNTRLTLKATSCLIYPPCCRPIPGQDNLGGTTTRKRWVLSSVWGNAALSSLVRVSSGRLKTFGCHVISVMDFLAHLSSGCGSVSSTEHQRQCQRLIYKLTDGAETPGFWLSAVANLAKMISISFFRSRKQLWPTVRLAQNGKNDTELW